MPFNFNMPKGPFPGVSGALGRMASGAGNAARSAGNAVQSAYNSPAGQSFRSGIGQVANAAMPIVAGHAAQAIGNRVGGQAGQMIQQVGQSYANPYGYPQQPQKSAQDYIQQGNQWGQNAINQGQQVAGNAMQGAINQYLPGQFQDTNFGNMGNTAGGMTTDFLNRYLPQGQNGQPGLSDIFGQMAGNYVNQGVQRYIPQNYQNVNFGNAGNYMAQQGANMANRGLDYGTNYAQNQVSQFAPPMNYPYSNAY